MKTDNKEILDFVKEVNGKYARTYSAKLIKPNRPCDVNYRLKLFNVGKYSNAVALAQLLEARFAAEIHAKEFDIAVVPTWICGHYSINIYRRVPA